MAAIVHIQTALSESYKRTQGSTSENSAATIVERVSAKVSALQSNAILGGGSVRSSKFTAAIDATDGTCAYTGTAVASAVPQITITKAGKTTYGAVAWPDQTGSLWKQTRAATSTSKCPTSAQFNPLFGTVTAAPSAPGFSSVQRFYSAVFVIPPAPKRGAGKPQTVKVTMASTGTVPGETDATMASGTVTISWS